MGFQTAKKFDLSWPLKVEVQIRTLKFSKSNNSKFQFPMYSFQGKNNKLDWNIISESSFGRKTANIIIKNRIVYQEL